MRRSLNPTLTGLFPVLFWGLGVPTGRLFMERTGLLAYFSLMFFCLGLLGVGRNLTLQGRIIDRAVWRAPVFYGRWLCFVLYPCCLFTAIAIVQRPLLPLVILLNYLWPTAVIFCSILLAKVRVRRWWALVCGSAIVLAALGVEIVGPASLSNLRAGGTDALAAALAGTGAIFWGFYSALSRRGGDAAGGSDAIPLFQITLGLSLPLAILTPDEHWQNLGGIWLLIFAAYIAAQFFAYIAWDLGMRKGNVVILSLCADFIPWLSLIATHFMLGVAITQRVILSAMLLVAGAMITRFGTQQQKETFAELE